MSIYAFEYTDASYGDSTELNDFRVLKEPESLLSKDQPANDSCLSFAVAHGIVGIMIVIAIGVFGFLHIAEDVNRK